MKREIFTFIESEPVLCRVKKVIKETLHEIHQDPKLFFTNLLRSDASLAKRKQYLRIGITAASFIWLLGSVSYLGYYYTYPPQLAENSDRQQIVDLMPLPAMPLEVLPPPPHKGQGSSLPSGGGKNEMSPPTKGILPAIMQHPIVAPNVHTLIENPTLPVPEAIKGPINLPKQAIDLQVGDPNGVIGALSNGPGGPAGIGIGNGNTIGDTTGNNPYGIGGPPGPPSNNDDPVSIGSSDLIKPMLLTRPKPNYTEEARRSKVEGKVVLAAVLRADGTVSDIRVVQGLGYGLDEEAIRAAQGVQFRAGMKNGQKVSVKVRLEYTFSLL